MKNIRGISNIITAVLIIVLVLSSGMILFYYFENSIKNQKLGAKIDCINFELRNNRACFVYDNVEDKSEIKITLENNDEYKLVGSTKIRFWTKTADGKETKILRLLYPDNCEFPNGGLPNVWRFNTGEIKNFCWKRNDFFNDDRIKGKPYKFEIMPRIIYEGGEEFCDSLILGEFGEC